MYDILVRAANMKRKFKKSVHAYRQPQYILSVPSTHVACFVHIDRSQALNDMHFMPGYEDVFKEIIKSIFLDCHIFIDF